jgi:hypothetical protein
MTNSKLPYAWTKVKNGARSVALVALAVEQSSSSRNQVIECYTGEGFTSQGIIEEVPENGYDSWKISARHGLEYGFSLVDSFWTVTIHKIEGRVGTDTNPAIVGYTVLRAFLDRINFQLSEKHIETLEDFVLSSWAKPYRELIPDFFSLTFTEFGH